MRLRCSRSRCIVDYKMMLVVLACLAPCAMHESAPLYILYLRWRVTSQADNKTDVSDQVDARRCRSSNIVVVVVRAFFSL